MEGDAALLHRGEDRPPVDRRVVDQHPDPVRRLAGAEQVLDLAGDRLGLGALVVAAPADDPRLAEDLVQLDHRGAQRLRRLPPRARGAGRIYVVRALGRELAQDRPLRRGRVLELVDHHLGEAGGEPGAQVGALGEQPAEDEEDVGAVEVAGLGQDPVVGRAELGQLGLGRLGALLEGVDFAQQAGQQPGRVAADLAVAQRQLVEPVEQDRQPLGRAEHVEEGVEAGGARVLAQQPLAELLPGADPELAAALGEQRLDSPPQAQRRRSAGAEDEDRLGVLPVADQAGEAPRDRLGLAGAGRADQQQRPRVVADGALLGLGEGEHASTLPSGRRP